MKDLNSTNLYTASSNDIFVRNLLNSRTDIKLTSVTGVSFAFVYAQATGEVLIDNVVAQ